MKTPFFPTPTPYPQKKKKKKKHRKEKIVMEKEITQHSKLY